MEIVVPIVWFTEHRTTTLDIYEIFLHLQISPKCIKLRGQLCSRCEPWCLRFSFNFECAGNKNCVPSILRIAEI